MPIKELEIEEKKLTAEDKKPAEELAEVPPYEDDIDTDEDQETRLIQLLQDELEVIEAEREEKKLPQKWKRMRNLYYGKVPDTDMQFNLHRFVTKVKVDICTLNTMRAFYESDPMFSVTPRPEFATNNPEAYKVAEKQGEYLDYEFDNVIPFEDPNEKAVFFAYLFGLGWVEWNWKVTTVRRKRETVYRGKDEVVGTRRNAFGIKVPATRNYALEQLIKDLDKDADKYPGTIKKVKDGQTVRLVRNFKETTYNDPYPEHIETEDLYIRYDTEGEEGISAAKVILRKMCLNYWDLKALLDDLDVDEDKVNALLNEEKEGKSTRSKGYEKEDYEIFKCPVWFNLDPEDETDQEKLIVWWSKEKSVILKVQRYPYTHTDTNLVPYNVMKIEKGVYQPGIAEFTVATSIARNFIFNHVLEAWYAQSTITPIVSPESEIEKQFIEKRWTHGVPLIAREGSFRFLQEFMKPVDVNAALAFMSLMDRDDGDVTRASDLKSGRESPLDPDAPGNKTIALIQQSGLGISDYIRKLLPSFNLNSYIVLAMTYQMMNDEQSRSFQTRAARVAGEGMFENISRDDMIAKTNIQSQASTFDFDELNEFRKSLALLNILSAWPIFTRNPDGVRLMLKTIAKATSQKWSNLCERILVDDATFNKMKTNEALKALVITYKNATAEQEQTGQQTPIDTEKLKQAIAVMQKELVTAPSEEEVKAREEANESA